MPHHLKAVQLGHRAIDSVDGTDGILCFSVGHEVETRRVSKWFDIGNAKKYDFVAA
jgi:hypothetical protein